MKLRVALRSGSLAVNSPLPLSGAKAGVAIGGSFAPVTVMVRVLESEAPLSSVTVQLAMTWLVSPSRIDA